MNSSNEMSGFATTIMLQKYSQTKIDGSKETWPEIAYRVASNVLSVISASQETIDAVANIITRRKFIPGGRYLYASGRPFHQVQNCLLMRAEDSREGWADHLQKCAMALMTGAGIGIDYSSVRERGAIIGRTGGFATGPIALMQMTNECGRGIMQGGSRRCLPSGTKVTMADLTTKNIEDITVGDLVHTRFGPRSVSNVFDQGVQSIIEVTTRHGKVRSTDNHKWLTANSARTKTFSVPTKALNLDCKLYKLPVPRVGGKSIGTDLAYTIGYFLGDGCAYHSGRTDEVTFQLAGRRYNAGQASRIMGTLASLGWGNATTRNGHGDCTEIRCRGKEVMAYFQKYKMPNFPFHVPKEIIEASLEDRRAFIAGWFDADGYLGKDSWKLANTHPTTRKQVMEFLEDLGFIVSESGIEVRISSYQKQLYTDTIGKYTFKKSRYGTHKNTPEVPSEILAIKRVGDSQTFDIEVEGVHEFVADGFVTHNSAIWAGLNWKHKDIFEFIALKDWSPEVRVLKEKDFNFPATMDGTNISVQLDDEFFEAFHNPDYTHPIDPDNPDKYKHVTHQWVQDVYWKTVKQMLKTAEPGFSVDTGSNAGETLRNAPITGATRVLTSEGYKPVFELVNRSSSVWTGKQWSPCVEFKKTKENASIVRVTMSGGREIRCDRTHPFLVERYKGAGKHRKLVKIDRVAASDLSSGDTLHVSMPSLQKCRKLVKVLSVEEDGVEDVYCVDVQVEEHSFQAEGVIISNCTEVTSRDDSDICNLGSINMAQIESIEDMQLTVELGTLFLLAGTVYSDIPYEKVGEVRTKNRRLGLGLMGLHEWMLRRGLKYGPSDELAKYLDVYIKSTDIAGSMADAIGITRPVKTRAIAPTGTIGIMAGTTGGLEPLFCAAYKRRYLDGLTWKYQYVIDPIAKHLIESGADADSIEDAYTLAQEPERRVAFQAWLQQYVDHSISSTLNLPAWGTEFNNESRVQDFGNMLIEYLPRMRGFTCYPDGARGGQPLTPVSWKTAMKHKDEIFVEQMDVCDLTRGGTCGS